MERALGLHGEQADLAFNTSRPKSAASWGAIVAGALVAAGVSLILFSLGSGLGFASLSPWPGQGAGLKAFSIAAVIWLIVMQWVSSLFGGYITGRLRTRWIGTQVHEIFFRDTANGLVTWALATVIVAAVAASSVASGVGGTVKAASSVVGQSLAGASAAAAGNAAATGGAASSDAPASLEYGIDKLFRASGSGPSGSATSTGTGAPAAASISGAGSSISSAAGSASTGGSAGTPSGGAPERRMEVARIMMHSVSDGVSGADRTYLVGLVAARTGVSNAEAEQRVDDFIAAVKQAQDKVRADADAARKDAAEVSIYTALALLIGAFIASVAAALGGRLRDEHV
jgi:hypothetical protein